MGRELCAVYTYDAAEEEGHEGEGGGGGEVRWGWEGMFWGLRGQGALDGGGWLMGCGLPFDDAEPASR